MTSYRTPLGRARGLGPAKEGAAAHWIGERLPALGLIPLMLWFVFCAVIPNIGADYREFISFLSNPLNAALMLLVVLLGFYHGMQGLIVIIGDYIGITWLRNTTVFVLKLYTAFGAVLATFAIFRAAFLAVLVDLYTSSFGG